MSIRVAGQIIEYGVNSERDTRIAGQIIEYGVNSERDTRIAGQIVEYGVNSERDTRIAGQIVEYGVNSLEYQMFNFILGEAIIIPGNDNVSTVKIKRSIQGLLQSEQIASDIQGAFLFRYAGQKTGQN